MTPKDHESWLEHARWVRALAQDVLRDAELAENVTQEALVAAWRGRLATTEDPARLRHWLAATARNITRMTKRSDTNRRAREEEVARTRAESANPIDARIEVQRRVAEAVATLAPEDRQVVVLRYFDGLAVRAIAARLGTTPSAVSSRLSRARRSLRAQLDGRETEGQGSPPWALIALSSSWHPVAPPSAAAPGASASRALTPLPSGPTWVLTLAMKKIAAAAAALSLLLLGGFWFTDHSPDTPRVQATESAPAGSAHEAPIDDLVAVEAPLIERSHSLIPTPTELVEPAEIAAVVDAPHKTGSVLVRVINDATELPVQGVTVSLLSMGSSRWYDSREALTNALGEALFLDQPIASTQVTAWRTGVGGENGPSKRVEIRAGETAEVSIRLADGEVMTGRVVDELDRGVAGAEIWLSQGNGLPTTSQIVGHADDQGRFEIPHTGPIQAVGARAQGMNPSIQCMPGTFKPHDPEVGVKLVLGGLGGTLRGRVVTPGGESVPGAVVYVEPLGPPGVGTPIKTKTGYDYAPAALQIRADRNGAFTTKTMGSGSFSVSARGRRTDIARQEITVAPGGSAEFEIVVGSAGSLGGTITDHQGVPVAGANVSTLSEDWHFVSADVVTDHEGRYTFPDLPTGPVEISVFSGRAKPGLQEIVQIRPGSTTVWSPSLPAPLAIVGRAVSSDGASLSGFHVRGSAVGHNGPMARFQVDADESGRFEAPSCLDAVYDLALHGPGQWAGEPMVELKGVDAGSVDSVLTVDAETIPRGAVKGRVQDEEGNPLSFGLGLDGTRPLVLFRKSFKSGSGEFEVPYLPPGQYELIVEAAGYATRRMELASPLEEGEVRELPPISLVKEP